MVLQKYILVQEADLDSLEENVPFTKEAYIYFICRRPRFFVEPGSFVVNQHFFSMTFGIQHGNDRLAGPTYIEENNFGRTDLLLETHYPNSHFYIKTLDGRTLHEGKVGAYINHFCKLTQDPMLSEVEILYIGQGRSPNAINRLRKPHSTLQKISSHTLAQRPDSEIWVFLATFREDRHTMLNGAVELTKNEEASDLNKFLESVRNGGKTFSEEQKINLTEAVLINYFKTYPYNEKLLGSFPSPTHISYNEYYVADVNSILVELDTSEVGYKLFSASATRNSYHNTAFYFPKGSERYRIFGEGPYLS